MTENTNKLLPLNIQFFAEGGEGEGGAAANNGGGEGGEGGNNSQNNGNGSQLSAEELERLIQSEADKRTAKLGKEKADLQKELEKLQNEKLTEDERKQKEMEAKEKAMLEKEKALQEKENRLTALKLIKEAELDDGSKQSLEIIDFVMAENEEKIKERVTSFKNLVDRLVSAKVEQTFKQNGRVPNGGSNGGAGGDNKENGFAAKLGKEAAERAKKSNDILKQYGIGG